MAGAVIIEMHSFCLHWLPSTTKYKCMTPKQNYSNHSRIVPSFHFVLLGGIFVILLGATYSLIHVVNVGSGRVQALLIFLLTFSLMWVALFARSFALKAQDRAIRSEQQLRYFIAAGKPLTEKLHIKQIIALRFAGDEEFVALCEKALAENLSPKEIKLLISNWKGDYHRV